MCDTWIAMSDATLTQNVIFGKNSDRPVFDCQPLLFYPESRRPAGSTVRLEYLEIPQIDHTYATLGSSPYWCWGYEEGINEYSVVIGNEAIFTKAFRETRTALQSGTAPELGLLGMDLIRLALERSQTAREAVEVMGGLIERYGQFGSGVPTREHAEGGYDNSFIIADPKEAWIVEAVGKRWVAKRISQGCSSISNQPTIRTRWDLGSPDIEEYALKKGWWSDEQRTPFDFARAYIDEQVPRQVSHIRLMRSRQLLAQKMDRIIPQWMMRIARDHYEETFLGGPYFDAADPDFHSICMHASAADFTWGNTASSCVAVLPKSEDELPIFWWTPGPPCNGCYVPFFVHGSALPETVSRAGRLGKQVTLPSETVEDIFSPDSYWWLFKRLMDQVKGDPVGSLPNHYQRKNRIVRTKFDELERAFAASLPGILREVMKTKQANNTAIAHILNRFTASCIKQVLAALEELIEESSSPGFISRRIP